MEEYRREAETQLQSSGRNEVVIVGGDHNAHIGGGEARSNTIGNHGLRESNKAGKDLKNFCGAHGLAWIISFYPHKKRRTWFHQILRRWYELDGFMMKEGDRHTMVIKISTVQEASFSDHRP